MIKRIVITAGGTGGHLYPAQGFAQQLSKQHPDYECLFVAGGLASSRYFNQQAFPFEEVNCGPLLSRHPIKLIKGWGRILKGFYQSLAVLRRYRPDVIVGFGSYYTVPVLLAAKWLRIPIVLHEANSIPGKANKWFAPFAISTGVHFPYTISQLKGPAVEVGLPLREGYQRHLISKAEACRYFQLEADRQIMLVFGGSQGAKAINHLMEKILQEGYQLNVQVIHLTGESQAVPLLQCLYRQKGVKACVKAFEHQMQYAWSAADVFIGRSGASTIAESLEFEVPGVLIPYPHATDNHQEKNADFLVKTVGGAVKILESALTPQKLMELLQSIMSLPQREKHLQAMQEYKQRPSKLDLCQLVIQVAEKPRM